MNALILVAALIGGDYDLLGPAKVPFSYDLLNGPEVQTAQPHGRRIAYLISTKWCAPCNQVKQYTLPTLTKSGWLAKPIAESGVANVWLLDLEKDSETVVKFGARNDVGTYTIPQWVLVEDGKPIKRETGFKDADQVRSFFLSTSTLQVPAQSPAADHQRPKTHGPLYWNGDRRVWSWEGDLRQHLSGSPHNVSWKTLNDWSDRQCIQYHSRWHDKHGER